MSVFGQVWLWSVAAFVIGVLLAWLVLVRPVRARNRVLERRLRAAMAAPAPPMLPTRVSAPAGRYPPLPEPEFLAGRDELAPALPERFRPDSPSREHFLPEPELVGDRSEAGWSREGHGAAAEEDGREKVVGGPAREFAGFTSVLEPDGIPATELTSAFNFDDAPADRKAVEDKESEHGTLFDGDDPAQADAAGLAAADAQVTPPAYAFSPDAAPADDESPTETTQVLPQRQPRQARDGSAQPAPPLMRPVERREPVAADESGRSGSLFEPVVRRGGTAKDPILLPAPAPVPPPARADAPDSLPPGPFGPGSAMPRPGGGRPSDDFAVKASVTALRYCTEDSPHFSRMIAEVWFRSPSDAERVGFRLLG